MAVHSIAAVLGGQIPPGGRTTIQGWVRTRRDSKAGLSFIAVHDGSCFESLQVIAPVELSNYASEVTHLTAGCAIRVTGELVASPGKGPCVELRAESVEVVGGVEDPETYPIAPKPHSFEYLRTVAHLRPRTNSIGTPSLRMASTASWHRSTSVTSIGGYAAVPSMNFGSQCQNHRPSRHRRLVRSPLRSEGRGRCGL